MLIKSKEILGNQPCQFSVEVCFWRPALSPVTTLFPHDRHKTVIQNAGTEPWTYTADCMKIFYQLVIFHPRER